MGHVTLIMPLLGTWLGPYDPFLIFMPTIISRNGCSKRIAKFCMQIEYVKSSFWMTDYPLTGVVNIRDM